MPKAGGSPRGLRAGIHVGSGGMVVSSPRHMTSSSDSSVDSEVWELAGSESISVPKGRSLSFTIFGIVISANGGISTIWKAWASLGRFRTNLEEGVVPLLEEIEDGTATGGAGDEEVVGRGGRRLILGIELVVSGSSYRSSNLFSFVYESILCSVLLTTYLYRLACFFSFLLLSGLIFIGNSSYRLLTFFRFIFTGNSLYPLLLFLYALWAALSSLCCGLISI